MKKTMLVQTIALKLTALATAAVAVLCSALPAQAQVPRLATIFNYDKSWRYNDTGVNLGTAWSVDTFNDSAWPQASGLLGVEDVPGSYPTLNGNLLCCSPINIGPVNGRTPTLYFRTHFTSYASNMVGGFSLIASNMVDDGCVIYLNGVEAGRVRVDAGQTYLSFANAGPGAEGTADVITLLTNSLRVGDNVLAVEVHNVGATSSDLVWGMGLAVTVPPASPVGITAQPQDQIVVQGASLNISVVATGGPPSYVWQRDNGSGVFTNIPNATAATYTVASTPTTASGSYRVVVTSATTGNSVVSSAATVTVVTDTFGPRILSAIVQESALTNRILVQWDETVTSLSASLAANYSIVLQGTTNRVIITQISHQVNRTLLVVATNNWSVTGLSNYIMTVNNIKDTSGNLIDANTQVGIGWRILTNIFAPSQTWTFQNNNFFDNLWDTTVYKTNWYATNFNQVDNWGTGTGPFAHDQFLPETCLGSITLENTIGFQRPPIVFRTWFNWPAANSTNAELRAQYTVDDGAVFYLNGVEIPNSRFNMPAGFVDGPDYRAAANVVDPVCSTNTFLVNNLRPGTSNLMAVAVYQSTDVAENDTVFGLRADLVSVRTPSVPTPPRLNIATSATCIILSCTNANASECILESVVNKLGANTPGFRYNGPWTPVKTNMTTPYTNCSLTGPFKMYRLRKP